MATIKYFNGDTELFYPQGMLNKEFAQLFPGIKGLRYDSFHRYIGYGEGDYIKGRNPHPVERKIEYKSNPPLHKCDARCMSAKGRSCECSCGGKNHGAGSFICAAA
jgi:hypothetical protein